MNLGQERASHLPLVPGTLPGLAGAAATSVPSRCQNEGHDSNSGSHNTPEIRPPSLQPPDVSRVFDLHFKTMNLGLLRTLRIKDPNWIFMFAGGASTNCTQQNRKRTDLCCSLPFSPAPFCSLSALKV